MIHEAGQSILARVRSCRKLRTTISTEAETEEQALKGRQFSLPTNTFRPSTSLRPSTSFSRPRTSQSSDSTIKSPTRRSNSSASHVAHPNIQWDPLALNPSDTASHTAFPPRRSSISKQAYQCHKHHAASLQDLHPLRTKRSFAGHEFSRSDSIRTQSPPSPTKANYHQQRPRLHHSESGLSYKDFDFGFERQKAIERLLEQNRQGDIKPPSSSFSDDELRASCYTPETPTIDSEPHSHFSDDEDDDDDATPSESELPDLWHDGDYETAIAVPMLSSSVATATTMASSPPRSRDIANSASKTSSNGSWEHGDFTTPLSASPRRRIPPAADDPMYLIKRGGWKRRGIVFGGQQEEEGVVHEDEEVDLV